MRVGAENEHYVDFNENSLFVNGADGIRIINNLYNLGLFSHIEGGKSISKRDEYAMYSGIARSSGWESDVLAHLPQLDELFEEFGYDESKSFCDRYLTLIKQQQTLPIDTSFNLNRVIDVHMDDMSQRFVEDLNSDALNAFEKSKSAVQTISEARENMAKTGWTEGPLMSDHFFTLLTDLLDKFMKDNNTEVLEQIKIDYGEETSIALDNLIRMSILGRVDRLLEFGLETQLAHAEFDQEEEIIRLTTEALATALSR